MRSWVLTDPFVSAAAGDESRMLASGAWVSRAELRGLPGRDDCDLDDVREAGWSARCDVGGEGFPAYGRLLCDPATEDLACRPPASPAAVLAEYRMPGNGPVVAVRGGIGILNDRSLDLYDLAGDGSLTPRSSVRLSRPGYDLAVFAGHAFVGDRAGLTVYSLLTGDEVAAVPTCGKARRVFVDHGIAYVVGLRSVLVLDVVDAAAPVVRGEYRIVAGPGSAWLVPADRCGAFYRIADAVCDLTGLCGLTGRVAATESGNKLFLNLLDSTYLIDFTQGAAPLISAPLRTGLAKDLAWEGSLLYVNGVGCSRSVYEMDQDGMWIWGGAHEVDAWVRGVTEAGAFVVRRTPGRLAVGTRQ